LGGNQAIEPGTILVTLIRYTKGSRKEVPMLKTLMTAAFAGMLLAGAGLSIAAPGTPQQPIDDDKGVLKSDKRQAAGADRDAHDCIASAGYSWCAKTARCERPWELAKQHGFEATPEAYAGFCKAAGVRRDINKK